MSVDIHTCGEVGGFYSQQLIFKGHCTEARAQAVRPDHVSCKPDHQYHCQHHHCHSYCVLSTDYIAGVYGVLSHLSHLVRQMYCSHFKDEKTKVWGGKVPVTRL